MFKKFITLMMVISIFTVQAHATTQNGLKAAYDEMNYALSVEWDQKDQSVYEAQVKKFTSVVRDLQKSGMTNAQMIDFAKSVIKDAKVAKDLETAFSMITINKMSSEEASNYMISSMKRAYSNGASWNGNVLNFLITGVILIGLAIGIAGAASGDHDYYDYSTAGGCYEDCYYYNSVCYNSWSAYSCQVFTCDRVCN